MTENDRETESAEGTIVRRTMLKGAAVGLAGAAFAGSASAQSNVVTFRSTGEETFRYRFSVTGELERGGPYESDEGDTFVDEQTVEGAAGEGRADSFLFSGDIRTLELDGPGEVYVNDELIRDTTEPLPNRVVVSAEGQEAAYRFRVSGRVEEDGNLGSDDRISGQTVRGTIGGEGDDTDEYRYSGSVVVEETDEPVTVTLELNQD